MDENRELLLIAAKPNEMNIKLEETVVLRTDLQHEVEFAMDSKSNTESCNYQNMDIKIEVKDEYLWEDRPEETKCQPEVTFESVPVLQITKEEGVSENKGIDKDLPSSESTRLTTEAGYHYNSCTCTSPLERVHSPQGNVTLDCKASSVYTPHGKNDDGECSLRQNICSLHSNPPLEYDHHNKNGESGSELVAQRITHECKRLHKCEYCEKSFKKKYYLNRHIVIHSGTKPYKCDSCKKSFNKKSSLIRHIVIHSGTKPYKCGRCEKSFNSNSNLKAHIVCHSGIKPYKCDICKKSYNNKSNLIRHALCHSGTRPYKCSSCEKNFTRKSTLIRHALCHSDTKPYKCDHCEKRFKRKSHLIRHVLLHSGTKPKNVTVKLIKHALCTSNTKTYKCNSCEKTFALKSTLRRHALCHSDTKPFKCDNCKKHFKRKSCLTRHALRHSGSKI